jgi:hypothetical protein
MTLAPNIPEGLREGQKQSQTGVMDSGKSQEIKNVFISIGTKYS